MKIKLLNQILDVRNFGNKAVNLSKLIRTGFLVPKGFVVNSEVWREHVSEKELKILVEKVENTVDVDEVKILLSEIRKLISEAKITNDFEINIEKQVDKLSFKSFAIRSSATCEDCESASSAGQYDSFLGVTTISEIIESIKKCWISLWSYHAYLYRKTKGINQLNVDMAVIIQEMVPADYSGVIFCTNPVSDDKDKLILEFTCGLCEPLVSGAVTPGKIVF